MAIIQGTAEQLETATRVDPLDASVASAGLAADEVVLGHESHLGPGSPVDAGGGTTVGAAPVRQGVEKAVGGGIVALAG